MVKRIRGEAFTTRVSVQLGKEMIYAARGIFNRLLPDVYIASDYRKRSVAGKYGYNFFFFSNFLFLNIIRKFQKNFLMQLIWIWNFTSC